MDAYISKTPGKNSTLVVEMERDQIPADLVTDLSQIGWEIRDLTVPPGETWFNNNKGSMLFGLWTRDEAKKFLAQLRRVLRHHKIVAPVRIEYPD